MKNSIDPIWNAIAGIFIRLNLTEFGNRKLSLTNVALWVCIVKVAITPDASIIDLSALLLALFNYAHKRSVSAKASSNEIKKSSDEMEQLKDHVHKLVLRSEEQAKQLEEQGKVVEEAKSILTASKIQSTFTNKRQL